MSLEPRVVNGPDQYTCRHEDRNQCRKSSFWGRHGGTQSKAHKTTEYNFQKLIKIKIDFAKTIALACTLSLALALITAVAVQMAAGSPDSNVIVNKVVTPITGECNKSNVLLSVQGLGVQKPIDVFLVIDVSGSMGSLPSPTSLDHAKTAANSFVDQVLGANPSNQVGLVSFSDTSTLVRSLTSTASLLHSSINGLSASGSTNIDAGFWRAASQFSAPSCTRTQAIVLLSDGVANYYGHTAYPSSCTTWPTAHTTCTNAAISSGQAAWPNAVVFTVGLLGYVHTYQPASEWVAMDTLVQAQNGGYYQTYSGADLTTIFSQISTKLSPAARNAVVTDTVSGAFNIISGTVKISPSDRGTVSTIGNTITWNFGYLSSETVSLQYNVSCKSGTCGVQSVNTAASIYYQKTDCTYNTQTFPSPTTECVCLDCTITAASPVCSNSTGNTASTVVTSGATYSWTITNGVITAGAGTSSITYTAGSSGTTTLGVTVTKSGCSKTCTKSISITALPQCTITATSPVCSNSTGNTASTVVTSGATYSWTITNGVITAGAGTSSITYTAGSSGTTTLGVTVTASGCSRTCSKAISITPLPDCTITATSPVCGDSTGNTASTATAGATYLWTITNGAITSANNIQTITYTAGSTGYTNLSVTVTKSGCSKTCAKSVSITPLPDCTITAASPVCGSSTGNTASTATAGATYLWTITNGAITSANNIQTITYTAGSSGTTTLGVTVTKLGCSRTCTKGISITPLPDCTITAPSSVCYNSTGNNASTATSGATYLWTITNGTITSANNIQNITFSAGSSGNITLSVTVSKLGCSKTCTKVVSVIPCSRFIVSKIGNPKEVGPGDEVTYIINTTNNGDIPLSTVRVMDILPVLMVYVSDNRSGIVSGNMVTWENVGPLDPGESTYIKLVAEVNI